MYAGVGDRLVIHSVSVDGPVTRGDPAPEVRVAADGLRNDPAPRRPLPRGRAAAAVARCFLVSLGMLVRRDVELPRGNLGRELRFADGTSARVYRESTTRRSVTEPCFLAVTFRLRAVRGWGHRWFRRESLLNTPLFVGFPGFVSKLWLTHDGQGRYRGLYEWDGFEPAHRYARSLWRVLELVSEPGTVDYRVFVGLTRDAALRDPDLLDTYPSTPALWWHPVIGSPAPQEA